MPAGRALQSGFNKVAEQDGRQLEPAFVECGTVELQSETEVCFACALLERQHLQNWRSQGEGAWSLCTVSSSSIAAFFSVPSGRTTVICIYVDFTFRVYFS